MVGLAPWLTPSCAPRMWMSSCQWPHRVASASLTRLRRPRTTSFRASPVYILTLLVARACLPCCRRGVCAGSVCPFQPVSKLEAAMGRELTLFSRTSRASASLCPCVCFPVSVSCHRFKATTRSQWRTRLRPPRTCLAPPTPTTGDGYSVCCSPTLLLVREVGGGG